MAGIGALSEQIIIRERGKSEALVLCSFQSRGMGDIMSLSDQWEI
jgi:hypothetical protein